MQRLIFILSLFILAIVGCSSNESHSFLIRPDGGGEDAATEMVLRQIWWYFFYCE